MQHDIFKDLFVLEIANNHWGSLDRGKKIIRDHGEVVQKYGIKAAIKLQVRDVDSFIHKDFLSVAEQDEAESQNAPGTHTRYIKKTLATKLSKDDFRHLVEETKRLGMIPMATPFDEQSVDVCNEIGIEIMKIGSADAISWSLIEKIASLGKPTIISNGGTALEDLDDVVLYFEQKGVPLAINHCISLYPTEDHELELHQIDFLRRRYPNHVIGFSTHEYNDWRSSLLIAYAKGARTFERHIDIDSDGIPVSKYCSLPHQMEEWFDAYKIAKKMLGKDTMTQRYINEKEQAYIRSVCRGVYALRDLPKNYNLNLDGLGRDYYFAIPLQQGQLSERELRNDIRIASAVKKDEPVPAPAERPAYLIMP